MGHHWLVDRNGKINGCMTVGNIYFYKGFYFDTHYFCGPTKLNKDGEESKRTGRKFWKAFTEWQSLSPAKQRKFLISE
jgi:hypothetical protein